MQASLTLLLSKPANFVIFNSIWLSCVFGRYEWLWFSAPLTAGYLALLVWQEKISMSQIAAVAGLGITIDCLFTAAGLFQFPAGTGVIPLWLGVLWLAFSTTLPLAMSPLGRIKAIAAVAGAFGFPLNYSIGARAGAVVLAEPAITTLIIMSLTWAILLPLLFMIVEGNWKRVDVAAES